MILRTEGTHSIDESNHASYSNKRPKEMRPDSGTRAVLDLAAEIAARYEISALNGLLTTTRSAAAQDEISVAVLGRFKAGKSSFLNDLFGRSILPVGVVPVTAAITEIRYGARERACVHHQDGGNQVIP